jgi:hypothetical protein
LRKHSGEGAILLQPVAESLAQGKLVRSSGIDETEWFMPEWLHIYEGPFCWRLIKGKGTGHDTDDRRPP